MYRLTRQAGTKEQAVLESIKKVSIKSCCLRLCYGSYAACSQAEQENGACSTELDAPVRERVYRVLEIVNAAAAGGDGNSELSQGLREELLRELDGGGGGGGRGGGGAWAAWLSLLH